MSLAEGSTAAGRFSDGFKAEIMEAEVALEPDALLIVARDGRRWRWPAAAVRRVAQEGEEIGLRLTSVLQPDARLVLPDGALLGDLRRLCPDLEGEAGAVRKAVRVALAVATVLALVVGAYFGLPVLAVALAPVIPDAWQRDLGLRAERALAAAVSAPAGGSYCAGAGGAAAFAELLAPLVAAAGLPQPPHVAILDARLINAFALPGNRILLTRGMIEFAHDANELAGVIAHELGHLQHGDPLAALIARFEWGAVATLLFGGGTVSSFGQTIVLLSYSRAVEARADESGVAILRQAGIDSGGFAAVMRRMGQRDSPGFSYLQSHPATVDRVAAIERLGAKGEAALPEARWLDLKRICTAVRPL